MKLVAQFMYSVSVQEMVVTIIKYSVVGTLLAEKIGWWGLERENNP